MSYDTPGCAYCPSTVRACRQGEGEERGPGYCPSKVDPGGVATAREHYRDPFTARVARTAAVVESEGYCKWSRVEEICQLLNRAGCELNVIMGLCVGHDSLFNRHSQGLVTTLVTKDRVLAHNPVGALQLADTYYSRIWGPHRPDTLPSKPPQRKS